MRAELREMNPGTGTGTAGLLASFPDDISAAAAACRLVEVTISTPPYLNSYPAHISPISPIDHLTTCTDALVCSPASAALRNEHVRRIASLVARKHGRSRFPQRHVTWRGGRREGDREGEGEGEGKRPPPPWP